MSSGIALYYCGLCSLVQPCTVVMYVVRHNHVLLYSTVGFISHLGVNKSSQKTIASVIAVAGDAMPTYFGKTLQGAHTTLFLLMTW
jgi:hypothetical protein